MSSRYSWVVGGFVFLTCLGGLVYSKHSSSDEQKPIMLGAVFPMTGGLAQYGEMSSQASTLAVEGINRAGGVQGRSLALDVQDHQCQTPKALSALKGLTSVQGVRYFFAAGCSGTALAMAPTFTHQVMLGSAISSPKVSGVSPRFFRNYGTDSAGTKLFAQWIQDRQLTSVGVLHEETDYAKGLMLSLKEHLAGTSVIFRAESFASETTDLRTQITKMRETNTQVFFLSVQTVTTGNIALKQMQDLGYKPNVFIVNENILKSEQLRTTYKDLLEGAIGADFKVQDSDGLKRFLTAYKVRFGQDCPQINICATAYDNVHLLSQALGAVGEDDQKVMDYLRTVSYEGVSGRVSFDEKNDRKDNGYALFKIVEGKVVAQ